MLFNWFDIVIVSWLACTIYKGYHRGLCAAFVYFGGFYLACLVSIFFGNHLTKYLSEIYKNVYPEKTIFYTTYFIIFIGAFVVASLFSILPRKWSVDWVSNSLNKLGGIFFGLILGIITSGVFVYFASFLRIDFVEKHFFYKSLLAPIMLIKVKDMFPLFL